MSDDLRVPTMDEIDELIQQLRVVLRGKGPLMQGAALADAVAMFCAGHHPQLRDECIENWIDTMKNLIDPVEQEMRESFGGRLPWDDEPPPRRQ